MDQQLVQAYRRLCREGFQHTGEIKNPSIFLDTVGEKFRICAHISHAYLNLHIKIRKDIIEDIKYLCTCDPTANVVVEMLCSILKGKTVTEAENITEEDFSNTLGSREDDFLKRARAIIELLHRGIDRYKAAKS